MPGVGVAVRTALDMLNLHVHPSFQLQLAKAAVALGVAGFDLDTFPPLAREWYFGEAGEYICSRNEHASLDIRHKSTEMSTRA